MSVVIFWASLAFLAYAYLGYPLLVALAARNGSSAPVGRAGPWPRVSFLLAVHNEEAVIRRKIENFLALDYPSELLELLIVSDGSTDGTEGIAAACGDGRVRLLVQPARQGKTAALNRGAVEATGDILVFTDADSMFRPDALRPLVAPFADRAVGLVSGRTLYVHPETGAPQSAGLYRAYEEWIKARESKAFSIVGADGAIYALRRELYRPLPPELINDFVHTIQVAIDGFRAVSVPEAVCLEPVEERGLGELARQVRIMTQSWRVALTLLPALLDAGRSGYVWQLCSHKVARWLSLLGMVPLLTTSLLLVGRGWFYAFALAAQVLLYGAAGLGLSRRRGLVRVAFNFVLLQIAGAMGLYGYLTGATYVVWKPRAD
jgi:cellulose synthase/poly-beta-1,6-N-acetylglucosamine synthase-like glycosyltransferase